MDLPPRALVALIRFSVTADTLSGTIQDILALPPPAPSYRVELRHGLSAEDAVKVLQVLSGWAELYAGDKEGLIGWDGEKQPSRDLPGLEAVSF
jgi:hypothetical protein